MGGSAATRKTSMSENIYFQFLPSRFLQVMCEECAVCVRPKAGGLVYLRLF